MATTFFVLWRQNFPSGVMSEILKSINQSMKMWFVDSSKNCGIPDLDIVPLTAHIARALSSLNG